MNYRDDVEILLYAVEEGDIDIVGYLLEYGADPNMKNIYGSVALIRATLNDNLDTVKVLLECDIDTNLKNIWRYSLDRCDIK